MRRIAAALLIAAGLVTIPSVASAKPDGYIGFGRWVGWHSTHAPDGIRTPSLPRATLHK